MKKLLFIINTMGRAGAETALTELLKRLDAMNQYEIFLYTMIPCGELFDRVPKRVHVMNRHICKHSLNSFQGSLWMLGSVLNAFFFNMTGFRMAGSLLGNLKEQKASHRKLQPDKLLWRLLANGKPKRKENFDLAVAFIEGASTYYLADKVKACHKVAFLHIDYENAGYTPKMDQDCYSMMERIFVVSGEVGKKFSGVYPQHQDKVRIFRNLLDKESIRKKAEEVGFVDDFQGIRLVTVGRLHYQKGYDIAVEALARLRTAGYDARWYVIGEGSERSALEQLIKKYGVEESFVLLGAKENPYPFIKQADIYVHATRFEGKSIAIEEAQILGKTILASDCTGNSEQILSGYDGVLLTLNVENLVSELIKVIKDPELRKYYEEHVLEKELDYPEDLDEMLALLEEGDGK